MGRIYYCPLLSSIIQLIIHILWMVSQLASITENGLLNIQTQSLSHNPVLKVLSHMVTIEGKQQVLWADIFDI